jgi:hypothetical protein
MGTRISFSQLRQRYRRGNHKVKIEEESHESPAAERKIEGNDL